jgi:release factor glutamine methyltransferase
VSGERADGSPSIAAASAAELPGPGSVGASSVGDLVDELTRVLDRAAVDDPPAEARDLIAALLDVPRFWPTMHRGQAASCELVDLARRAAVRRAAGAPFAYAVGRAAFRHLTLAVDERVLIPRQETEVLVDLVLACGLPAGGIAVDVATGSGAIALALASEGRFDRVIATDVSADALAVARANAARLASGRAPVELAIGSYLAPAATLLRGALARSIVSNPPYIAYGEATALPPSVRDWEPSLALLSGDEGMGAIRTIARDAARHLEPDGVLALEVDARRASLAAECVAADPRYRSVEVRFDLTGRERFVLARRAR